MSIKYSYLTTQVVCMTSYFNILSMQNGVNMISLVELYVLWLV